MSSYGDYFKALREAKGLTLRKVEKETDVSNAYLSQLENGKIKQPSPVTLYKLSQLYEVDYEILMEKVGYPVPKGDNEKIENSASKVFRRFGAISEDEEKELLEYLKFIRNRK